ncbi:FAD:protein FMN transferase [Undibacterium sp. YM2]|uniref:FAD:protein FMN transferase n=1 Tax=Undibacterium sp. YM2 TaxID=2058625 RepID=UPI001331EA58|nr:FAD:protein FMN transferase [Undibacterium sp. YM2]BBB64408.1 FAD:protein FMN transferase [Undibacterium sp. YM2]
MRRVFIPLDVAEPQIPPAHAISHTLSGLSMGTSWTVQLLCLPAHDVHELQAGIEAELNQVVMQMSTWDPSSYLCEFNRAAANSWQSLPAEFFKLVDYSLYLSQQTGGAYDITAGKLVDLWGFGPAGKRDSTPTETEIHTVLQAGNWKSLELDHLNQRIRQTGTSSVALDLSSIAKGFALDQIARYLDANKISSYLIELGGELRGLGMKKDQAPWWVRIESPAGNKEKLGKEYLVALHGLSIATSGDYRQYFEQDGRRYAHTLDPRTGYPADNDLASVTVLHPECMVADAMATALTVLGCAAGLDYAEQHQIAALFLQRTASGFEEKMSRALRAMLD